MFLYWEGYEIDGSDTDFEIILPESRQLIEFVECFLSIPLFDHEMEPSIFYTEKSESKELSVQELNERLASGHFPEIYIEMNCAHPEELPLELRREIYNISPLREPHEEAFGKVENPCAAPELQTCHTRGGMTVEMTISSNKNWKKNYSKEWEPDGYINNFELFLSDDNSLPLFSTNIGPGFYYEYARYIMDYLIDHFPGLGTYGGLDCAGGWTEGCTYADSLYEYEKFQFPIPYSINNTMKRLSEYGLATSYRQYYKNKWILEELPVFNMVNNTSVEVDKKGIRGISFADYVQLVDSEIMNQKDAFSSICNTAINVVLPRKELFSDNPVAVKRLEQALREISDPESHWHYRAFLAFLMIDGKPYYEYRIGWRMKDYFLTLLDLIQSGEVDFVKAIMYRKRKND